MKNSLDSYFDNPLFKHALTQYEEMLLKGSSCYFEATELTDIAEYYAMKGDASRAEAALDYAIRLHPDNLDALIFKARARLINGHLGDAISIIESISDQSDREVLFLKAELALAQSQQALANEIFRMLIEDEQGDVETYTDIIDLLTDNNQADLANQWLEEALIHYPDKRELIESAAYMYSLQERFDEAIDLYNQLLDMDAYSTLYWEELGKIYFRREEFDKAIEAFEYAIAINDNKPDYALYAAANCYFNIGNYEKAEEYYQIIHHQYPETVDPLFHMGMCRVNRGDDDKALEYFTEALTTTMEESEEQAQIYSQMSLIFSRKSLHSKAINYVEKALEICPNNSELIIMKGHELLCQGDYDKSNETFLQAIELESESPDRSLFLISVSMLENNHYEMGYYILQLLKKSKKIEPNLLYPYLCLCEWVLRKEGFKETLTEALTICPTRTYEIFTLEPAQGESAEQVIERLSASI